VVIVAEFVERNGPRFTSLERAAARREALLMAETGMSQVEIAKHFDVNQSVIHVWLRKERGEEHYMALRAAAKIREKLVCCDIFEQMEELRGDLLAQQRLRESKAYHDICYFGEWAARIASDVR
jgi:predicted transcriptional regulator